MDKELGFKNKGAALLVAEELIDENYVVMLSKEEDSTIVNYEWSLGSDRNDIIFKSKEDAEDNCEAILDENMAFPLSTGEVERQIRHFFLDEYDVKLEDSPQIVSDYLYLEFDTIELGERKLRIKFDENMSHDMFMRCNKYERENWLCRKVLAYLL